MSTRSRARLFVALGVACVLLAAVAYAQPSTALNFRVIGAKLVADPPEYAGTCPAVIKFHGSIETNGPGVVKYIFERSDGGIDTIIKSVTFTAPPFHLTIPDQTWTLGGPGMTFSGWERIKILSPNAGFLSNQAKFTIKCAGGTQPPAGTAAGAPATNMKVIGAKLAADPPAYTGNCPTVIKFHGVIETNGPGVVKYIFERSDGGIDTIVKSVTFTTPPFHLTIPDQTWTLGGPGMTYSGWERIKILSPNAGFLSNEAKFMVRCTGGTQPGGTPGYPGYPGTPTTAPGQADLVVTQFGFTGPVQGQGQCLPHTAVYIFQVTVKNQGTAPSPSSAALGNKALVQAMAQDKAGWGNGALLNSLAPGASQTVTIPVYYLMSDPTFMTTHLPHPFMAIADPLGLVSESDETNNRKGPINMGAPANCPPPPATNVPR